MNYLFLLVLAIILVGESLGLAEQDGASIDGLRCDSCGLECSTVCGSRQFRTCCFNYIKKRSDPSVLTSDSQQNQNLQLPLSGRREGDRDRQRLSPKHLRRDYSLTFDQMMDDRRWYPWPPAAIF